MAGRINIDNLSASLQKIIQDSGLTEEQVIQIIEENISGNIEELATNDKSSLVAAINELFQNANNGKELIANAIGEPVSKDDTFSAMSDDINGLLSTFKANMMNNGIAVESNDRFKTLIDKLITLNDNEHKGIQIASGVTTAYTFHSNATGFIVNNLLFKPVIVIAFNISTDNTRVALVVNYDGVSEGFLGLNGSGKTISYKDDPVDTDGYSGFYNNGFKIITTVSNIEYQQNYKWIAIGVGEEDNTLRDSLADILVTDGVDVTEEDDMASLITKVEQELNSRSVIKRGTMGYPSGKIGERNNEYVIITHNLGSIPSYIMCRTGNLDYMPGGGSVGRSSSGPLCLTSTNNSYMMANGNEARLTITDINETTFKVVTTMQTTGMLSGYIEEWLVIK